MVCYRYNPDIGMNERVVCSVLSRGIVRSGDKVVDSSSFRQRDDLVRHYMATGKINTTARLMFDSDGVDSVFGDLRSKKLDIVDREHLAASVQSEYEQKVSQVENKMKAKQDSEALDEDYARIKAQKHEKNEGSA